MIHPCRAHLQVYLEIGHDQRELPLLQFEDLLLAVHGLDEDQGAILVRQARHRVARYSAQWLRAYVFIGEKRVDDLIMIMVHREDLMDPMGDVIRLRLGLSGMQRTHDANHVLRQALVCGQNTRPTTASSHHQSLAGEVGEGDGRRPPTDAEVIREIPLGRQVGMGRVSP